RAEAAATLQELTGLFARMIAGEGFIRHVCLSIDETGSLEALFGDAAVLPAAGAGGLPEGDLVVPAQCWHGGELYICLGGRGSPLDAGERASLRGRAEVYACYGLALFERERDFPTGTGLGFVQRQCLAQLLVGQGDAQIAGQLGISPLAVRGHIEQAMR